jgi:hypothetical protein
VTWLAVGFKRLQLAAKIISAAPNVQIMYFILKLLLKTHILDVEIDGREPFLLFLTVS